MPDWNELFKDAANVLPDPAPLAMELAESAPPRWRVLDLGCGAGRHLLPLARAGLRPVGFDRARRGLARSRDLLEDAGYVPALALGDFRRPFPFPDRVFDAVLAVKSVNHALPEEAGNAFAEVTRVLRPGGRFVGTVIASSDARFGDGREVAENTFVHDRPPEAGVVHHYFTEAELRGLLAGWSFLDLSLVERVVSPGEPVFGAYRFRPGVAPVFRHWNFRAIR